MKYVKIKDIHVHIKDITIKTKQNYSHIETSDIAGL